MVSDGDGGDGGKYYVHRTVLQSPETKQVPNGLVCLTHGAEKPVLAKQPFIDRDCGWTYLVPVSQEN